MWDEYVTGPSPVSSGSVLDSIRGVFDAGVSRAGQELQRAIAGEQFTATDPRYGVNEYGQPYLAGKATFPGTIAGVPAPLVLVGVGILALAIVLHAKR